MTSPLNVTFYGGAEGITGVNVLIETSGSPKTRILIDCGLFQGERIGDAKNRAPFAYDPGSIDALFVTHAHIDHTGRIPKLLKDGFRGKIFSTPPTKEIARLLLLDSLGILEKEAIAEGKPLIYEESDVESAMQYWHTVSYRTSFEVGSLSVRFLDAGHVLGSAMIEIRYGNSVFLFSGDLGNSPSPILPNTDHISGVTYLFIESVYGDRNHEHRDDRKERVEDVIEETMKQGGVLMVPAFSFERTQEFLFEIREMMMRSRIPLVPVYLDSPLAIHVTDVYREYISYYKEEAKKTDIMGDDIFGFPQLHRTLKTEESRAIAGKKGPKIIIAGAGMSNGGRILHHEKEYLGNPKNALLLLGYQAHGTLGRKLQDGARMVKIFGEDVPVQARVVTVGGYSAHKDSSHLLELVRETADSLRKVFVVLGEPKSSLFLIQRIRDYLGVPAVMPRLEETITLDM